MKCRNQRTTKEETGRNQRGRVLCKGKGTRVCIQGFLPLVSMKHPAFPKCSWFWEPSVTAHGTQGSHKTSPRKLAEAGTTGISKLLRQKRKWDKCAMSCFVFSYTEMLPWASHMQGKGFYFEIGSCLLPSMTSDLGFPLLQFFYRYVPPSPAKQMLSYELLDPQYLEQGLSLGEKKKPEIWAPLKISGLLICI